QRGLFKRQAAIRTLLSGGVNARVRHFAQPATDMYVRGDRVELETRALERGRQRYQEAALEVTVEAFHLALRFRSIRSAQAQAEPELLGQGQQSGVPSMLALTVGVALDDDGLGVVEQDMARHATEVDQR